MEEDIHHPTELPIVVHSGYNEHTFFNLRSPKAKYKILHSKHMVAKQIDFKRKAK